TYRRPGADESSTRDYSPIALIARPPAFHLLVSLAPDWDPFVLALHRIQKVQALDARAQPPVDFELDAYLAGDDLNALVDDDKAIRLELKCHRALADHWRDAELGREQTITADGESARIAVSVHDTQALRAYLLGFATQIEVLAPAVLRRWFRMETAALAARYAAPAKRNGPRKGNTSKQ
ncbi:transcriptional regulator-like protein, partial [mine drainage metagenome]